MLSVLHRGFFSHDVLRPQRRLNIRRHPLPNTLLIDVEERVAQVDAEIDLTISTRSDTDCLREGKLFCRQRNSRSMAHPILVADLGQLDQRGQRAGAEAAATVSASAFLEPVPVDQHTPNWDGARGGAGSAHRSQAERFSPGEKRGPGRFPFERGSRDAPRCCPLHVHRTLINPLGTINALEGEQAFSPHSRC